MFFSLHRASLGHKGKGRGWLIPGLRLLPGSMKGRDRWADAGHHPVTLRKLIGFQRRTGFVNGASLLLAAFKWMLLVAWPARLPCEWIAAVGGEETRGDSPLSSPPLSG